MRTSSHQYNLSRSVGVSLVTFAGTAEQPQLIYSYESLPTKPASEVFSNSVYQRGEEHSIDSLMETLHERVSNLLNQMDARHTTKDIFALLDQICTEPAIKQCLENYLAVAGYSRR